MIFCNNELKILQCISIWWYDNNQIISAPVRSNGKSGETKMGITEQQKEMQQIIEDCIISNSYNTAYECLKIYKNTCGIDEFYRACSLDIVCRSGPLVSLICIQSNISEVQIFLKGQNYKNIEVFYVSSDDWENEVITYINAANGKYICFYEPGYKYDSCKISMMVCMAEHISFADAVICTRNFIDDEDHMIAKHDRVYQAILENKIFDGRQLIEYSISNDVNIYGNLSTLLLSVQYGRQLKFDLSEITLSMRTLAFFHQMLLQAKIGYLYLPLVSEVLKPYLDVSNIYQDYEKYLLLLYKNGSIALETLENVHSCHKQPDHIPCSRDITFFYTDMAEYYNVKPIADEAKKRGYAVTFSDDLSKKAEIGIYCQHISHPGDARFSVILLHDLGQGQEFWPNLWEIERWNEFDLGILPGKSWAERWSQCACQYYANPRFGVFELGYPKSDLVGTDILKKNGDRLRSQLNLKHKISVLYAPSWENDGKEDDFVSAISDLNVNLLIKQDDYTEKYPECINNVRQMRELHEGKFDNVYYIEPKESIMTALSICDIVVSDESNVMSEALMFGKKSIAVIDWLIPDITPSRRACVPVDYVIKCHKEELRECIYKLINSPECYEDFLEKGRNVFSNIGHCCRDIMDAVEYFAGIDNFRGRKYEFLEKKLVSKYLQCSMPYVISADIGLKNQDFK